MKNVQIMIDLETLDQVPTAVVCSMAVVFFDIVDGIVLSYQKWNFDIMHQLSKGRTVSVDTINWWQEKGVSLHQIIENAGQDRIDFLGNDLKLFLFSIDLKDRIVWSRGVDFDLPILKNILKEKAHTLWDFRNQRDLRTLEAWWPEEREAVPRDPLAHDPLVDCKNQIKILTRIYNRVKPSGQ